MMHIRLAERRDAEAIAALMELAIEELQRGYLDPEQIEASRAGMGLDLQLIDDGTYFCVEEDNFLIGCGGWSRRATLYGGSHTAGRDARLLDPAIERARIRAMYTHPKHARRGVGAKILEAAENAARDEGFVAAELVGTLAGQPFYLAAGYAVERDWYDRNGAVPVPIATMSKTLV
ncbi:MAG: GNAT family N-acetyltransferase [Erythrobacter sp.]|nr:GNAT family N-acetyltransferase [Erythrobacter sp.]